MADPGSGPNSEPDPTIEDVRDPLDRTTISDAPPGMGAAPGDSIGAFKIVRVIGEGGFGVVYLAEQVEGIKRKVALKVVKPGMDTRSVIARFEAERQSLALMDHPGIAKVFDAGLTQQGRPYFVMEYIQGLPIDRFCNKFKLGTRARLRIFAKVCDAVQHAHTKGVIHRDLKPENILVSVDEQQHAVPRIIDFGIAKAMDVDAVERSLATQEGQLIGTLAYMSPEQAVGRADAVDTRSDVYSLGVVLYQLLAGRLPFDPRDVGEAGFVEMQRMIAEVDPPRPSNRVGMLVDHEATTIADARNTGIGELESMLRRELEWIPLKALRKSRDERYASPKELADDVRRYLGGDALEAGPESAMYRMKKFVRRNKGPVFAAALIVLSIIAGLVGTGWFALSASEQARIAEENAAQAEEARERAVTLADAEAQQRVIANAKTRDAEREAARATAVKDFVTMMLASVDPEVARDLREGEVMSLVLADASESLASQFSDEPLVEAELRNVIGRTYRSLGQYDQAETHLVSALEVRQDLLGPDHPDTLDSMNSLGLLMWDRGNYADAEWYIRSTLEYRRDLRGDHHPETLDSTNALGVVLRDQNQLAEAELHLQEALEGRRQVLGEEHPDTLSSLHNMGVLLSRLGKYEEAVPYFRNALDGRRDVHGVEHPRTLTSLHALGMVLLHQEKFDEAESYFRVALDTSRRVYGDEHPRTFTCLMGMGALLTSSKVVRHQAEPYFREAYEGRLSVLGEDHPDTLSSAHVLAVYILLPGGPSSRAASKLAKSAYEGRRRVLGNEHVATLDSAVALGSFYRFQNQFRDAEPLYLNALSGYRRMYNAGDPLGQTQSDEGLFSRYITGDEEHKLHYMLGVMINFHEDWHAEEPNAGYDAKAAEYRAMLEELNTTDE